MNIRISGQIRENDREIDITADYESYDGAMTAFQTEIAVQTLADQVVRKLLAARAA